jgi:hypothetical protein
MIRRRHDYTYVVEVVRADDDESFTGSVQQIFRETNGQPPESFAPALGACDGATRDEAIERARAAADAWIDWHRAAERHRKRRTSP